MSPSRDVGFWIAVSGVLLGLWSTMLSYVLRAFGQRMDRLESSKPAEGCVPRPEYEQVIEMIREDFKSFKVGIKEDLKEIKDGIKDVHKRLNDQFKEG